MPVITQVLSKASLFDYMKWLTIIMLSIISHLVKPFVELTKTPKLVNKPILNIMYTVINKNSLRSTIEIPLRFIGFKAKIQEQLLLLQIIQEALVSKS